MQLNTKKKRIAFIAKAICHHLILLNDKELVPDSLFDTIFPYLNIFYVPDRSIIANERLKSRIDWNKFEKPQLIRLLCRDISIVNNVDISRYNFSVMDLYPLFLIHTEMVDYFDIDFNSLNAYEAIKMLECNSDFIHRMDFAKYNFDKKQTSDIIRKFGSIDDIMSQVNLEKLDHFDLRNLLKKTNTKYIDRVNLSALKANDWVEILRSSPDLLEYCNLLPFEQGDCYLLVKLAEMFPQLDYLIEEKKDKISGLGWELLLIHDAEKYQSLCNWQLLSKKNWENILNKRPELENIKRTYIL